MPKLVYPIHGTYQEQSVDVSIVIPLYKSDLVIKEQIQRWVTDDGLRAEIIYVDDRCPKGSKRAVFQSWNKRRDKQKYLVKLVLSENNLGFGGACNLGARYASGKYLVFLNADTIVTPNWLMPMVELFDDEKVAIVGNLHIKDGGEWHGSIDSAGSEWTWEHLNFMHVGRHIFNGKLLEKPYFPHDAPAEIMSVGEREMVTGCCFMIRRNVFDEVGGFNPNYRIGYWEDSELCLMVREHGYKIMFQPESVIYHKLHHSESGDHIFAKWNRDYFNNKWIDSQRIDRLVKAKRNLRPVSVKNILVRRQAARGDVLWAAAVLPAIHKKYPQAKIYFSTICDEVLVGNPHVHHVLRESEIHKHVFQLRYNLDMAYERRPLTNFLQSYADEAGVRVEDCEPFLKQDEYPLEGLDKFVVVHAGCTAWAGRNWIPKRFDELAKRMPHPVVCVGSKGDHLVPCQLDLRGKTTIQQLAYVMAKATLFVGIDSLPMHIAQVVKTPGVCFFGCIIPETRLIRKNMKAVTASLPCLGCHQKGFMPSVATTECPLKTSDCENMVSVDDMWEKVKEALCCKSA
jgi:GT2 family glycosyltransferase/ADP-heptose:LPS heptosyltransferase